MNIELLKMLIDLADSELKGEVEEMWPASFEELENMNDEEALATCSLMEDYLETCQKHLNDMRNRFRMYKSNRSKQQIEDFLTKKYSPEVLAALKDMKFDHQKFAEDMQRRRNAMFQVNLPKFNFHN